MSSENCIDCIILSAIGPAFVTLEIHDRIATLHNNLLIRLAFREMQIHSLAVSQSIRQ